MSTEVQAGFPCPHLIVEEIVSLGSDRRSLETRAPIASAPSVRVLVNNQIYVPPGGFSSQAVLQGGAGPYRIERCTGLKGSTENQITVTSSVGTATVSLPLGSRVKVADLERALKLTSLDSLVTISVRGGSITFSDTATTGARSFVRVTGEGASALRFTQRGARGRLVYPGWDLISRQDVYPSVTARGLIPVAARYPRFNKPVPGNPVIKVTYAAMPERCPRCQATYVENDYRFDLEGQIRIIQNEDLLYQTCLKAILTLKGSNPYHPGYGSSVMSRVGRKSTQASAARIREDVINALSQVQGVQSQQRKYQQVKDRERLYRVNSVMVTPSPNDPTVFHLDISVTNGTGKPVSLNIVYSAPGAVALAGSNGQSLGAPSSQRFLIE